MRVCEGGVLLEAGDRIEKEKAELQKQSRLNGLANIFAVLLNVWSTGILRVHRADRIFYALSYEHHESGDQRV